MTDDDTVTAKLAEWEALVEGATEGPWSTWAGLNPDGTYHYTVGPIGDPEVEVCETPRSPQGNEDAEFIAAARHMVPALLAFVREVRAGHAREPYVDEPSEGFCRDCQRGGAAGTWPCPTEQAARKWIGGEG